MDGGQISYLDLNGNIDSSSCDMLVPINSVQYQHLYEKWQGRYLPNSFRYEHNGWAAGWYVYEIDYVNSSYLSNNMYVTLDTMSSYYHRYTITDSSGSTLATYAIRTQLTAEVKDNSAELLQSITYRYDDLTGVQYTYFDVKMPDNTDRTATVSYNHLTRTFDVEDTSEPATTNKIVLSSSIIKNDNEFSFSLEDNNSIKEFSIYVYSADVLTIQDCSVTPTYTNSIHTWAFPYGNLLYDSNSDVLSFTKNEDYERDITLSINSSSRSDNTLNMSIDYIINTSFTFVPNSTTNTYYIGIIAFDADSFKQVLTSDVTVSTDYDFNYAVTSVSTSTLNILNTFETNFTTVIPYYVSFDVFKFTPCLPVNVDITYSVDTSSYDLISSPVLQVLYANVSGSQSGEVDELTDNITDTYVLNDSERYVIMQRADDMYLPNTWQPLRFKPNSNYHIGGEVYWSNYIDFSAFDYTLYNSINPKESIAEVALVDNAALIESLCTTAKDITYYASLSKDNTSAVVLDEIETISYYTSLLGSEASQWTYKAEEISDSLQEYSISDTAVDWTYIFNSDGTVNKSSSYLRYESVTPNFTLDNWQPFSKLLKVNIIYNGNTYTGAYGVDPTNDRVFLTATAFANFLRGTAGDTPDAQDCVVAQDDYSRTRGVIQYSKVNDFNDTVNYWWYTSATYTAEELFNYTFNNRYSSFIDITIDTVTSSISYDYVPYIRKVIYDKHGITLIFIACMFPCYAYSFLLKDNISIMESNGEDISDKYTATLHYHEPISTIDILAQGGIDFYNIPIIGLSLDGSFSSTDSIRAFIYYYKGKEVPAIIKATPSTSTPTTIEVQSSSSSLLVPSLTITYGSNGSITFSDSSVLAKYDTFIDSSTSIVYIPIKGYTLSTLYWNSPINLSDLSTNSDVYKDHFSFELTPYDSSMSHMLLLDRDDNSIPYTRYCIDQSVVSALYNATTSDDETVTYTINYSLRQAIKSDTYTVYCIDENSNVTEVHVDNIISTLSTTDTVTNIPLVYSLTFSDKIVIPTVLSDLVDAIEKVNFRLYTVTKSIAGSRSAVYAYLEGELNGVTWKSNEVALSGNTIVSFDAKSFEVTDTDNTTYVLSLNKFTTTVGPGAISATFTDELPCTISNSLDLSTQLWKVDKGTLAVSYIDGDLRATINYNDITVISSVSNSAIISVDPSIYFKGSSIKADNKLIIISIKYIDTLSIEGHMWGTVANNSDIERLQLTTDSTNITEMTYHATTGEDAIIPIDSSLDMSPTAIVKCTNIAKSSTDENASQSIMRINCSDQYQILKQQWDSDVSTENFWWLDDSHILKLDNYKFIVLSKEDTVDDWNGDEWTESAAWLRQDILNSTAYIYFCSSSYATNPHAIFTTVSGNKNILSFRLYDFLSGKSTQTDSDNNTIDISISHKDLIDPDTYKKSIGIDSSGSVVYTIPENCTLNSSNKTINTYCQFIDAKYILAKARWSSTVVAYTEDDTTYYKLIIGCHVDSNYNQWALLFDVAFDDDDVITIDKDSYKIIQGYGFVGLKGDLTGGQLPSKAKGPVYGFSSDYEFFENGNSYVQLFDADRGFTGAICSTDMIQYRKSVDVDYISEDDDDVVTVEDSEDYTTYKGKFLASVVGTLGHQWYIANEVSDVVSQLVWQSDGTYDVQVLPMTNTYTEKYATPSYASATLGDNYLQMASPLSIFGIYTNNRGNTAYSLWDWLRYAYNLLLQLAVPIFYWQPRLSQIVYLQQAFGQYAYVHYNNGESEASIFELNKVSFDNYNNYGRDLSDYIIGSNYKYTTKAVAPTFNSKYMFNKVLFKQTCNESFFNVPILTQIIKYAYSFIGSMHGNFIEDIATSNVSTDTAINEYDKDGKHYRETTTSTDTVTTHTITTDFSSLNGIEDSISHMTTINADSQPARSLIAGCKSLSMFYSTCDSQHVYAGPGFVEHQFEADCVAQSSTHVNANGNCYALNIFMSSLTDLVNDLTTWLIDKLLSLVKKIFNLILFHSSDSDGDSIVSRVMNHVSKFVHELADNSCPPNTYGFTEKGHIHHQHPFIESTHKYGKKNEIFMWPCFTGSTSVIYTDEIPVATISNKSWNLDLCACPRSINNRFVTSIGFPGLNINLYAKNIGMNTTLNTVGGRLSPTYKFYEDSETSQYTYFTNMRGDVPYYVPMVYSTKTSRSCPSDMTVIQGSTSILPDTPFVNADIDAGDPVFVPSLIHDYVLDTEWSLSQCCSYGITNWVACKDTKLINGEYSNIVIRKSDSLVEDDGFCGIACTYTTIELKKSISKKYMRPWAITPDALALNCTGFNCAYDAEMYHAFDGYSYRYVSYNGMPGLNLNRRTFVYSFQTNNRFKRSNKLAPNQLQGAFESEPIQTIHSIDPLWILVTESSRRKGIEGGTIGEDKDLLRYSIPIFTEPVSTLPAAVKTLAAMPLGVVEGITSLCTTLANSQNNYKAPKSVDFTIGKQAYRITNEYICSIDTQKGQIVTQDLVPTLGATFIGATPLQAFFYSEATRCYYTYTGGTNFFKTDMLERFRQVNGGFWDFVNQEVVMPCLLTFNRLEPAIEDDTDETDNIVVPVLSNGGLSGELPPPITTIFNNKSWYKTVSLPSGLAYQGPNRVIINRSVFVKYMLNDIKNNLGKWQKLPREVYSRFRTYPAKFETVTKDVDSELVGWTHNQFVLVTSPLGIDEDIDCMYEWNITFCWPVEMDLIYAADMYACVNVAAETITPGGKVMSRPTHIFLTKDLFTRNSKYGYYSFRYQSNNGAGNRERLHIWSDAYIAISSISVTYKPISQKRSDILTQQVDVQDKLEL